MRQAQVARAALAEVAPATTPLLDFELPTWRPKSRQDLQANLDAIAACLAGRWGPNAVRLWYRGQALEFSHSRPAEISEWLHLPNTDISMLPTLARPGAMPTDRDEAMAAAWGSDFLWRAPIISWLAMQRGYAPPDPETQKRLDDFITDVPANVPEIVNDLLPNDPSLEALNDRVQLWLFDDRAPALTLWMQHYGARTTPCWDATSDPIVALYFARRAWSDAVAGCFVAADEQPSTAEYLRLRRVHGWRRVHRGLRQSDGRAQPALSVPPRIQNQSCALLIGIERYRTKPGGGFARVGRSPR